MTAMPSTPRKYMDITDIANEIRANLKAEFPAYRFSVRIERYSGGQSMTVTLVSGPTNPFAHTLHNSKGELYCDVNHKWLGESNKWGAHQTALRTYLEKRPNDVDADSKCGYYGLTSEGYDMMSKVNEISNTRNWDNSDSQIDYFDVNYYFHLQIGRWDKPYVVTVPKGTK